MPFPRPTLPSLVVVLLTLTASPGSGQEVELLADLNPDPAPRGSGISRWTRAGSHLYFFRGGVLWRTDATTAGTELVRELESSFGATTAIGLADGRLLFAAKDAAFGGELWVSDGTAAGTRLAADLCPGPCDADLGTTTFGRTASGFIRLADEVLFVAYAGPPVGYRLHAVDPETGPPRIVSEISPRRFTVSGDRVFLLEQQSDAPWRLWVSDGQPGSEVLAAELPVTFAWSFLPFAPDPARPGVLLIAKGAGDEELDIFYGDEQGARRLVDVGAPSSFGSAATGPGLAYVSFVGNGGCRLYRTDGTAAGTFELVAAAGRCARRLTVAGDRLFFALATAEHGEELWVSDGTQGGTRLVSDVFPGSEDSEPMRLTPRGAELFFFAHGAAGPGLWKSDGTAGGTEELRTFQQVDGESSGRTRPLGVLDGSVVFAAADSDSGLEVWASDGTPAGTELVANLTADEASSSPRTFIPRTGDVVFRADSGDPASELYRVGSAGAVELAYRSEEMFFGVLGKAGDRVLYVTVDDPHFGPTHVFALDPVTGDAEEVLTVPRIAEIETVGRRLFLVTGRFFSSSTVRREEIWVTDGTAGGTARVSGDSEAPFSPQDLVAWGDVLAFSGFDEGSGREPWISDGTTEGTRRLADLVPGAAGSDPDLMAAAGHRLYLRATLDEGSPHLVAIDRGGSVRGTVPVAEDVSPRDPAVALGGRILWSARSYLDDPEEVWASDGSAAGTHLLGTFLETGELVASGRRAYFTAATAEHGMELWVSDGTPGGTRLVGDLEPGRESSDPAELRAFGGSVLFNARTAAAGREPWFSDGSAAGTRRLADVAPGGAGSRPEGLVPVGERIVFAAERDDVGRELFALPRSAVVTPCVPGAHNLCLNDGRFSVEADWRDFAGSRGGGRAVGLTDHRAKDRISDPHTEYVVV